MSEVFLGHLKSETHHASAVAIWPEQSQLSIIASIHLHAFKAIDELV